MYQVHLSRSVQKTIKKMGIPLRKETKKALDLLKTNPYAGNRLTKPFEGIWSYHFRYQGVAYRIAYEVYPQQLLVLVIKIGTRENFYQELKSKL